MKSEQSLQYNNFSINNVSSYLLPCCMNNVPVSFLVDTGAGHIKTWSLKKEIAEILKKFLVTL